uniref:Uncharacterized protein n=1 Tax=Meloidogyne enterolobii TaxID=390850 RepID=A0A6V7XFR5_MELEN|nr:unnamed protein product [Meloidogyne enterolobii]
MDYQPPSKRARGFFIEELFADRPEILQNGRGNFNIKNDQFPIENYTNQLSLSNSVFSISNYVKKLDQNTEFNNKFKFIKHRSTFLIENIPSDPEVLLSNIFNHCLEYTINECNERGLEADSVGCLISSELLNPEIWLPIREINQNTIESMLNRFNQVAQSKAQENVTLWGKPFQVSFTAVARKSLPKERKIMGGNNTRKGIRLAPMNHRINDQCLIKVRNLDGMNHCLFFAMQATLFHNIKGWQRWRFYDYIHSRLGQRGCLERDVKDLMNKINVPIGLNSYDAKIYVPLIIDYWNNNLYFGQYRFKLYIFETTGHYKPIYKYGPGDYSISLILYLDNNHFYGVQRVGNLFGAPYCLECESTYVRQSAHTKSCKARCIKCSRMGPCFPCLPENEFKKFCTLCFKSFHNSDCFNYHISSNFCNKSKECRQCGKVWDVQVNTRNGRKGHVCNERFCFNCKAYHDPKRGCFIKQLNIKTPKPYRVVSFDVETMQHDYIENDLNKRNHQINFIGVRVACPSCIDNGNWKISLKNFNNICQVCGDNRSITFSQRNYFETNVDKKVNF